MTGNAVSLLHIWGEGPDCRITLDGTVYSTLDVVRCDTQAAVTSIALPENTRMVRPLDAEAGSWLVAAAGRLMTLDSDGERLWSDYLGFDLGAGDNAILWPRLGGGIDVTIGSDTMVTRMRVDAALLFEDAFEEADR